MRLVAYGLPLLVLVAAAIDTDVWPATGWRLFSRVRTGTEVTWFIEVVDHSGDVHRFDPGVHDPAQRQWRHQVQATREDPERQLDLCRRWLEDARSVHPTARQLSVQRALIEIPRRAGDTGRVHDAVEVVGCRR